MDARSALVFANDVAKEHRESAIFAFEQALLKAKQAKDIPLVFAVYRDNGIFFEDQGLLDSASTYYINALNIAAEAGLGEQKMTVLNDLAIVARKREKYSASRDYHFQVLELAEKAKDLELVEYSWHGLGFLYEMVGDHEQALVYYQKSYEVASRRNNKNGMMVTLGNLAQVFSEIGNEKQGLEHTKTGLTLAFAERDTEQIAQLYFINGEILTKFGQYDSAKEYYERSIPFFRITRQWNSEATVLMALGRIAAKMGDWQLETDNYKACLKHADLVSPEIRIEAYLNLGRMANNAKQYDAALQYYQNALKHARIAQIKEMEISALQALHNCYVGMHNPSLALEFLQLSNNLYDSLSTVQRKRGSAELAFRYDLEKSKRALQELENQQSRMRTIAVLLIGLFAISALGYSLHLRRRSNAILKLKNAAIMAQNVRLEESNGFLYQFTYAVAHDLKEPLRTISNFITILEKKYGHHFTGNGIEYMGFVLKGVDRMHALIKDLLEFSNISAQRPTDEITNLKETLDQVKVTMAEEIKAKNGLLIYPSEMPSVQMKPEHLEYLLTNLIHNSLKFNGEEVPTAKVNAVQQKNHVLVSVEDNGIGIEKEHGRHIFDLFNQLHKNKPYGGTGIGLTICKNIIDKYDGSIWFEPNGEKGTRFWVSLPINA